jgi:hypothetical protein
MKLFLVILVVASSVAGALAAGVTDSACKGVIHGVASDDHGQPVAGINLSLDPLGVLLAYILPYTRTNGAGEYRFEHVCPGRFTVFVDDEQSGYASSYFTRVINKNPEVLLTEETSEIELPVHIPPKAGVLYIAARDGRTNANIPLLEVKLRTSKIKMYDWMTINHNTSQPFLLPANVDLKCRVTAKGYRELKGCGKKGKQLRLAPESRMTLTIELEPRH